MNRHALVTILLFSCLSFGFQAQVHTEEVRIPVGSQAGEALAKPRHGTTKLDVEAQFGAPLNRFGPVGIPPIYYWEYGAFTVYFEDDRVIHTVSKVKSKTPVRK